MAYSDNKTVAGLEAKATPVDADVVVTGDSADSDRAKKTTYAQVRTWIEAFTSYFNKSSDTLDDITTGTTNVHFTAADNTKLDGIETSATADQTGAEIKTAYEAEANTNAFTDADHSKLDGIEAGATADQTGAEIKTAYEAEADTNAYTDAEKTKLAGIEASADVTDATNVAAAGAPIITSGAGAPVSTPSTVGDIYVDTTGDNVYIATDTVSSADWDQATGAGGGDLLAANNLSDLANAATARTNLGVAIGTDVQAYDAVLAATTASFTTADETKLDGIETSATADQTGAEIKTAYEAEADTNAFTDADHTKLDGIEASADVTDATNVAAAGALMTDGSAEMSADIVFAESADHSSTPGAGKGYLWVKNTAPSSIIFTDDTGADTTLGAGGGGGDVTAAATFDTDNVLIRSDGTSKGVQKTGWSIDDNDKLGNGADTTWGINLVGDSPSDTNIGQKTHSDVSTNGAGISGYRARGTTASPTATQAGDWLLGNTGRGYGTTGFSAGSKSRFVMHAAETWTDSAQGTYTTIWNTPTGSTTSAEHFRFNADGSISMDGGTTNISAAEMGYLDGVTSAIQTQLDAKLASSSYDDATTAETNTGTSTAKYVSPDGLAGSYAGTKDVQVTCFDYTTDTATGDGKAYIHIPAALNGMNLVAVHAEVITAGTTGTTDIQIANVTDAVDMLSTKLTIDSGETGSDTAATAAVINTATDDVATNDLLRVDVDAVSTTAAKGLIVTLSFRLP